MKKRMLSIMPALLVVIAFLFSGLTTVTAQSLATDSGSAYYNGPNGKTAINYLSADDAISTIRIDFGVQFPNPDIAADENQSNAAEVWGMQFYYRTAHLIGETQDVAKSISQAYVEIKEQANSKWPNLVTEQWYDDMVTLLSL